MRKVLEEERSIWLMRNFNDVEREILNIIKNRGFTTNKINTETLGISSYKSVRYCNNLIEKGAIKKEGKGRNVRYTLVN